MNVTNLSAGKWQIESESSPGRFYTVLYNSDAAIKQGVKYSCDCKSWVNNQYNRECKHTKEIQNLIANKVMSLTNKTSVQVTNYPSMGMARKRGRPSFDETKRCPSCNVRTVKMKQFGICNKCGYNKATGITERRNRTTGYKSRANDPDDVEVIEESKPYINDETVELSKEALKEISKRLDI